MKIKSLRDTVLQSLPSEALGSALPLWVKDIPENKTGFQVLAKDFIDRYRSELCREKEAVEQALASGRASLADVQQALDLLKTPHPRRILCEDAKANKEILGKLLQERIEYEQYLQQILNEAKSTKNKPDTGNRILNDVCELIEVMSTVYIKTTTDTIRRFRSQQAALIDVVTLDDKSVDERLGGKKKLLLSQLSGIEKNISEHSASLLNIENALKELDQAEQAT